MADSYNGIALPSSGTKITYDGKFIIPDNPIIPFIEGDGTGRDIWKASVRVFDAAVEIAYNGKRRVCVVRGVRRREGHGPLQDVAAGRHGRGLPRSACRHQGPADHAHRRRHSLAECRAAADSRSLCLRAPGEVLRGHPFAGKEPAPHEHGDLSARTRKTFMPASSGKREHRRRKS